VTATLSRVARSSGLRYIVVGVLSFVTDAGALFVLHGLLHVWLPLATGLAFASAFVVNFGLNRVWAFRASGAVGRQLRRYLSLVAANLVATVVLVPALTSLGLPYLVAKACTTVLLAIVNYFVSRKWIFL
jgi:putative flippase GtrA